ncbi:hypothetical protein GGR52DRAFT_581448 [Hypoxylon sp. FL1284]|nr:hypothetical protein GGR52DRAFT_581448 [Hypoxylon sp. FL1284]
MSYVQPSGPSANPPAQIHSTGITELYVPDSPALEGDQKRQAPSDPVSDSPSKRKLVNFLPISRAGTSHKSNGSMSTGVTGEYPYWPRDLVPRVIPDARVLTFGYDTHIRHSIYGSPPSQNRLLEHGGDFLCALEDCRRSNPSHPLLFIAHSLGGLVVKEALRQSKSYEQDQPSRALIYSSTKGIIFFGTPHLGADPLNAVHDCLVSVVKLLQFKVNDGIIQTLRPNSERLVILHEEFLRMTRTQNWRVHSFQEELPVPALSKKVVEDSSSCINERQHERTTHIRENHVDMCRFNDLDDPEFRKVEAALLFMRDSMQQKRPSITPKEREKILNKLKFESVGIRYMSWLLEGDVYNAWRDTTKLPDHHGFLWIKGKPGAGNLVVSFFFNARGDRLEKSTEGMYRALSHRENIIPLMDMPDNKPWPLEVLKQAFRSVISQASSLDFSEDEIRDMVYFLEEIAEQALERNILFRVFRKGLELTLEDEPDHRGDIHQYVQSKLRIKEGNYRETVEQEILDRSDNIFLWAALVVDILNKEYDKGGDLTVRKRFQEIPNGLHDLFEDILTRDNEDMDKLILCLQWLLFSKRPLTSEELYFAIQSSMDPKASLLLNPEDVKSNRIDRFNLNASKGLVQISKRNPTVQFIHESVRDYLLREHGFRKLVEHHHGMGEDVEGTSNEILKLGCLNQLNHHEVAIPDDLFPELSNPESWRSNIHIIFPFYQYAVSNILGHADAAQGKGVCQINFMATFPRERWIKFDNIERYPSLGNKGDTSLIYLLAENNSANLIRNHPDRHLGFMQPASPRQHEFPIGAAIASGSHSVIRTLTIEAVKSQSGFIDVVRVMCTSGHADANLADRSGRTPLSYAAEKSNASMIECLFKSGALPNIADEQGRTPLHYAVSAYTERCNTLTNPISRVGRR